MPAITVIVPVYKVEAYLGRCLDSILDQTYADFDLILIDDGSPDRCGAICDEYAEKDSRIHVIHQKNMGLSGARNAGIDWAFEFSNSEWLTFIDSDDWVHPKYLEALFHAVKQNHVDIACCSYMKTNGEPIPEDLSLESRVWEPAKLGLEGSNWLMTACMKLYRRNCFLEARFPIGKLHEDAFVAYRLLFRYSKIAVIEQPLYAYYNNPDSIMRREWTPRRLDELDAHEEQLMFFENNGFIELAKIRFNTYANLNINNQEEAKHSKIIDMREKKQIVEKLRVDLKKKLKKYRKYGWRFPWRCIDDFRVYSYAYRGLRVLFVFCKGIKNMLFPNDKK